MHLYKTVPGAMETLTTMILVTLGNWFCQNYTSLDLSQSISSCFNQLNLIAVCNFTSSSRTPSSPPVAPLLPLFRLTNTTSVALERNPHKLTRHHGEIELAFGNKKSPNDAFGFGGLTIAFGGSQHPQNLQYLVIHLQKIVTLHQGTKWLLHLRCYHNNCTFSLYER